MNWDAVGAIGEVVGAAGVIATLAYLALQIRLNTNAQKSESRLATTRSLTDWYSTVMTQPELMRVWAAGHDEPGNLSDEDRQTFIWMMAALFSRIDEIYSQYQAGLVSETYWNDYRGAVASFLDNPVVKESWDSKGTVYTDGFREAIDATDAKLKVWRPESVAQAVRGKKTH